jgi:hypothetical protein
MREAFPAVMRWRRVHDPIGPERRDLSPIQVRCPRRAAESVPLLLAGFA